MTLLSATNYNLIKNADTEGLLSFREDIKANTLKNPQWLHFGSGNIFRSYIAFIAQKLIAKRLLDTGIIICEAYDEQILEESYKNNDCISLSCTLKNDGTLDINPVLSVVKALCINKDREDRNFYLNALSNPSLMLISFSITEKAYEIYDANGSLLPCIEENLNTSLDDATNILSIIILGLYKRFLKDRLPLTLMALDNCKHNGEKLKSAILTLAHLYLQKGQLCQSFIDYLKNDIAYPLSMIDKIAPRPDCDVLEKLKHLGYILDPIVKTQKGTHTAQFVNSESTAYLVIEDNFKNQRPKFEHADVIMTDKNSVMLCERMKIESCLNPLQTAAALCGMLLNKKYIADCMQEPCINLLVKTLGFEGCKVVQDPKVINYKEFLQEAIDIRMPNPYINDTPARIATDSSSKIAIRLGLSLKRYIESNKDINSLKAIPLVYALFIRYCSGIDDCGKAFNRPNDLNLDYIIKWGSSINVNNADLKTHQSIMTFIQNTNIMGCDLVSSGLDKKILKLTLAMCQGPGSVKDTLNKNL